MSHERVIAVSHKRVIAMSHERVMGELWVFVVEGFAFFLFCWLEEEFRERPLVAHECTNAFSFCDEKHQKRLEFVLC